jgi:hemoglobin/transferrin/lactoferrin receptor protein
MKKIFILWLFLGMCSSAYSQIMTVMDQEMGHPLERVALTSENPKASATTNGKGQIEISQFQNAEKIEIRLFGYTTEFRSYAELKEAGFVILLTPSGFEMDEVVVSATRWSQDSKEIPAKISAISGQEVALQNPQTAADLLGASGEVFIQKSQQGGGSPMIRGFSTNRLLYTVDGVRMNTAIFRSGNLQNVISLDPFATERTEVFFGPGSVIYGSDAIGGVMSFQTLTPQLSSEDKTLTTGKAVSRYSSANGEKTSHFDINIGWKRWASVTSFSANDFGDLRMGGKGPDEYLRPFYVQRQDNVDVVVTSNDPRLQRPSAYSQVNIMQKIRFVPGDAWDFQYGFHFSETSDYSRYDRHVRYRNGLPRYGEWSYGPQKWLMHNISLTNNRSNRWYDQMTIRLAQQYFEESRMDRDINEDERHVRKEKVDAYSVNLDFHKSIGQKHKFFYGLEAVQNNVSSIGIDEDIAAGNSMSGPARYPQAEWASYAAYVNYQFKLSETFLVQSGIRYNQYQLDATFDTTFYPFPYTTAHIDNAAITGSLGFVYRPTEQWVLSANVSTGFRSPNVDDAGKVFDSEAGSVVIPNPDLKAESAYNAEFGIAKIFGETAKIDFTSYYTLLNDALVRRDFTLNGQDSIVYDGTLSQVQAIQNAAVAKVYGIQAGFEAKLPAGFRFSSSFNYQKGEEELDDGTKSPSRHAAPWFGVSRLIYKSDGLNMQVYAMYSGEKKFDDLPQEEQGKPEIYAIDKNGNPWSPGWYTLNFKAIYQLTNNLTIGAGLENMMDKRYRPYSSGIVAAGRNFILTATANF